MHLSTAVRRTVAVTVIGALWLLAAAALTSLAPRAQAHADDEPLPSVVSVAAGSQHTCALDDVGDVRCWGNGGLGRLGYANTDSVGDDEDPSDAGAVDVGGASTAIVATSNSTCALLEDGAVRCWGFGGVGQLGYGETDNIGDDETPAEAGTVDLGGPSRSALALTAGANHVCALLDNATVTCWGSGGFGRLGYGNQSNVGDDETPAVVGAVNVGGGSGVTAIAAGMFHTCALLEDGNVRCWGFGQEGALGLGTTASIGDNETPAAVGPVKVGGAATALAAGGAQTCAFVPSASDGLRCWGRNDHGQLGTGNTVTIGDNETPLAAPPMTLGGTPRALAIGGSHACGVFAGDAVRCWGLGSSGQLGHADTADIGAAAPVTNAGSIDLDRPATALTAGDAHTCVVMDGAVGCWGAGGNGRLGYGDTASIGDDESPAAAGTIRLIVRDAAPVAVDDRVVVAEGSDAIVLDVVGNDLDPDGGPRRVESISDPAHGTAAIVAGGSAVSYRPDAGYCTVPGSEPDLLAYQLGGGSTATVEITVTCADKVAPETRITTPANPLGVNLWFSGTGRLTFVSNEAGSSFECRIDSGAFSPCTSGQAFTVPTGQHTIAVRARDAAGNADASPALRKVTVFRLGLR